MFLSFNAAWNQRLSILPPGVLPAHRPELLSWLSVLFRFEIRSPSAGYLPALPQPVIRYAKGAKF
jgi:hypothetical protein